MERTGGSRRKSRYKLTKEIRDKGKISVSRFMQDFAVGQSVHLIMEPAFFRGTYHTRFIGKTGTIKSLRGNCYEVSINDGGKEKTLLIHPVHLKATK